ncbi:SRPBCC family protein [Nocardia coubleae]|uniref:SRPBCC family protein n=1 Tax=Nocardia coubleae TaxID=356147 RepID=A0A846WCK9_9NOCA|nr:SRPBCC family protein [Nocardia coubleae]NKX90310.1 SRPBCC family protein [Nocardia coubleae]
METIAAERFIAAPIEQVFEWCADTRNYGRSFWVLRNRWVRPGTDAPYGVGAVRRHLWMIGRFTERITRYDPPHAFDYLVERSFPPSRHDGGTMTFTSEPGGTRVRWTSVGEVKAPFAAATITRLTTPIAAMVFGKILDACAKDLGVSARR